MPGLGPDASTSTLIRISGRGGRATRVSCRKRTPDALAFQAERTLRDLGDKVAAEDRADVEGKVPALPAAFIGDGSGPGGDAGPETADDETVEGVYKEV